MNEQPLKSLPLKVLFKWALLLLLALAGLSQAGFAGVTAKGNVPAGPALRALPDAQAPSAGITPANGATDVAIAANLVLVFSEPVVKDNGFIVISYGSTSQPVDVTSSAVSLSADGLTATINPNDFPHAALVSVAVANTAFKDTSGNYYAGTTANTWSFTTAAAPVVACTPISTLPCNQLAVTIPFNLAFTGSEGGLSNTGFTMADAPSAIAPTAGNPIPGFDPARLSFDAGRLRVVTAPGIAFLANNNQINTLGVQFSPDRKFALETILVNPFMGTSGQQGGLWFGLSDKTFIKLVAVNDRVEMRREVNDVSNTSLPDPENPDKRVTGVLTGLATQTVRLRLVVDPVANTVDGFYSTDGVTYLNVGAAYAVRSISLAGMGVTGTAAYGGIFATHRNGTLLTYTFDNFSITTPPNTAPVFTKTAYTLWVNETAGVGTQVGTVKANDAELQAVTYAITAGNEAGKFAINSVSGVITLVAELSYAEAAVYNLTVTATDNGSPALSASVPVTVNVNNGTVAEEVKVNFQDPTTIPPAGWIRDYGQAYGPRTGQYQGTNLEYGWKSRANSTLLDLSVGGATNSGNGRNRNSSLDPDIDVLLATLMHMQADNISGGFEGTKAEGYWEIKVPNGVYDVTVTAGDGTVNTSPEVHSLNVEGVSAVAGFVPAGGAGSATRFKAGTVRVAVLDERLTINADGGTNTKINSARIRPVSTQPFLYWSSNSQDLAVDQGNSNSFSMQLKTSDNPGPVTVSLSAEYGSNGAGWLSFNPTHSTGDPTVYFTYNGGSLPVGTYTATVKATATGYTEALSYIQLSVVASGTTRPYVKASSPADGASNVSINIASIVANELYVPAVSGFKGGVDNSTLSSSTVKLLKVAGSLETQISGIIQGTGGGDAISFTPSFALESNTTYRFVITEGVKSYAGTPFMPYESTFTTGSVVTNAEPLPVSFQPVPIDMTNGEKYSTLAVGPDRKLYGLLLDGTIKRFPINADGSLGTPQQINSLTAAYGPRSAIGFTFDPASTADNLIVWVSHCSAGLSNAPEFDGNISRLSGPNLGNVELMLTRLPRAKGDHLVNSIAFGPDGALYFCQGSNSSMGAYDGIWQRDESLLAGAVLRLDPVKLQQVPLPLNVETTPNLAHINAAPANSLTTADGKYNPYSTLSPLTIFASGVRNAYDLVWHSNGQLYVPANGSAAGGNSPASVAGTRQPDGTFYNGPSIPATFDVQVQNDWLFRVNPNKPVGYYGHPNPLRGEYVTNRGRLDNSKYPAGIVADINYRGSAYNFALNKSPNGAIEYKNASAFGGLLKGKLLVCRFSGGSDIMVLEPGATAEVPGATDDFIYDITKAWTGAGTPGIPGFSGFANPLDITEDTLTGNLYVIEYVWQPNDVRTPRITLLRVGSLTGQGVASVSPEKIVDNDVAGGAAGVSRTITIANTGSSILNITGIALTGTDASQFQLLGAPAASPGAPHVLSPNSAITFGVAFNPTTTGLKTARLQVTSADNPVKEVLLSGLGTSGLSGENEPSLQAVLDVHGVNNNVGDDDKQTSIINSATPTAGLLGEEVRVQRFVRSNDGPVTVEVLSVFGPQSSGGIVTGFGWYPSGNVGARSELFTVANSSYQTVNPQVTGSKSFDPGNAEFSFYSRWPFFSNRLVYGEDAQNTFTGAIPHHVRVYPLKKADGTVLPDAYVMATEEHTSGFDYQDIVVIVRNIKPAPVSQTAQLSVSAGSVNFGSQLLYTTSQPRTLTLTHTGADGSADITLGSIVSGNPAFVVTQPGVTTLSPGATANFTVSFKPTAAGTATGSLAISHNSTNSPLTISVTGSGAPAARIDFQPAGGATHPGYTADVGLAYDEARGFGWFDPLSKAPKANQGYARERNSTDEVRLRSLNNMRHVSAGPGQYADWEYKIPNGFYQVTVAVGDADFFDSFYFINAEGVPVISNFVATTQNKYRVATAAVEVKDGRLTIDARGGPANNNTKINYIDIAPINPAEDLIAPEVSVSLAGTLASDGVYSNEATLTVMASDQGLSALKSVEYSLDGETFFPYLSPVRVSREGSYRIRARATDGNNNQTVSPESAFSIVKPVLTHARLLVENLDRFPASDQLAFSLVREPWRRQNSDGTYTPYNANHDTVTVRLHNKGSGTLQINALTFSRPGSYQVVQLITPTTTTTVTPGSPLPLPISVRSNRYLDVVVRFVNDPNIAVDRVLILHDKLTVSTNDDYGPVKEVGLHTLLQNAGEGDNEATIQEIIDAFGFKTKTGFGKIAPNNGQTVVANSDEILSPYFVRADASKPIQVRYMAAYHGCCAFGESIKYFSKGTNKNSSNANATTHINLDGQSILPRKALPNQLSEASLSLGGVFSFNIGNNHVDPSLHNFTQQPADNKAMGIKVWKARDADGNIIPNTYIMGQDYLGQPLVTNYDYQDNVFLVSNIRPETGSAYYSELAATGSDVDFGDRSTGSVSTLTVGLQNLGQIALADPGISISSVKIEGQHASEFGVSLPGQLTLTPQEVTHLNVRFAPNSVGIKNAVLLVYSNAGTSPLRIPLYGTGKDNCNTVAVVKRIKGAATSGSAVTINGKVFESDVTYRKGNVKLDNTTDVTSAIAGTNDDALYRSYLSSNADLDEIRYEIPVAAGPYFVRLHFVENFFTAPGARVVSVNIENQLVLSNLDIFQEAGYKAALVKDFAVTSDQVLNINFKPSVNRLALAGVEIFARAGNPLSVKLQAVSLTPSACGAATGAIQVAAVNTTDPVLYKLGSTGTYGTSGTFTGLKAGQYTVYVKEDVVGGCETSGIFTVAENNPITFTVATTEASCDLNDGTATVSGVAGGAEPYTYSWSTSPVQTGSKATGLAAGSYVVTVTDNTGCKMSQTITVGRKSGCRYVDFQPPAGLVFNGVTTTGATHPGYTADLGEAYNDTRGFGWIDPVTKAPKANGLGRERTGTDPLRLRSFNHMRHNDGPAVYADWEYTLPNGFYKVTVGVGDAEFFNSAHYVNVEGVPVISNFVATSQNKYLVATATVEVKDGKLTVDANSSPANNNTKIGYIDIFPVAPPAAAARLSVEAGSRKDAGRFNATLSPNPTEGEFSILLEGVSASAVTATTVTNAIGVTCLANAHRITGESSLGIDASALKSGTYFVKIHSGQAYKVVKLVKR